MDSDLEAFYYTKTFCYNNDEMKTLTKQEKILVIAPKFIGDGILSVIFFRNLRYKHPEALIEVFAKHAGADIISLFPYVDKVYKELDRKTIKANKYDKAYLIKRSLSSGLLTFNCGIKKVIGFNTQARRIFLSDTCKIQG
ncbi:MAG: hypothetical protein MZV64_26460 [Ignavibacteriales bacterium]|nr:hypothetical protein [Ignavibacteriales bacterium]